MLSVSRRVGLSPEEAWRVLVDTSVWHVWGPTVTDVDAADRCIRAGSTGRVRTLAGVWLPFEVTAFEPGTRWAWRVAGVPATGHRVRAHQDDGAVVTFEVPAWAAPYTAVCWLAAGRLDRAAALLEG